MKKLAWYDRIVFFFNSLLATLLLLGYALPFIPPQVFPALSVLTLLIPILIVINLLFLVYWGIRLKKQMLVSGLVLLLGIGHVFSLFNFTGTAFAKADEGVSIMSYNVRSFNLYDWKKDAQIPKRITDFVEEQSADVVCLQEYHSRAKLDPNKYPYRYKKMRGKKERMGQIIYSKYPIVGKGSLDFENTVNNVIYADIVKDKDTIRVYNVHLESLRVEPQLENLQQQNSRKLLGRLGNSFSKQQEQAEVFIQHQQACPHPYFIAGDFNNSAFSYVYRRIKNNHVDAFDQEGSGFGKTFTFDFIPLRIDFLLVPDSYEVRQFQNYEEIEFSDHYPIIGRFVKS
ncbi:endonuclease/exonuclease/phosphatase family protein [Croceiramulus getboli]|nr:endonuclease/exonuclease/phosphatase family protein [Flavobacteriaceae bacterium YJPT1-3]